MTQLRVRSPRAQALWLCLFDGDTEIRLPMARDGDDWLAQMPPPGARYGLRAEGEWAPECGLWFDPAKLLVDPRAVELDQPFTFDPRLSAFGIDTAGIVPKVVTPGLLSEVPLRAPLFTPGGLIYEVNVRGLTMLHPEIPETLRGTVAALAHPAMLAHFRKIGVDAIELMPIVAWIDERHLPSLGLRNAWGYNPVTLMALDHRLCPGGVAELREAVAALHAAGIAVLLDLVFNHTGESDVLGPVLSFRGLDNEVYAAAPDGQLINDTGCGNTLDFGNAAVRELVLEALRHFVRHCGIDGFRFDLATVMARSPGFDAQAPIFAEIAADPWLADRVLIAEPWDIGPGGYQVGRFPANWLEWNDRYRDDVRRFWRGDCGVGTLATRMAGSADLFGKGPSRSVNFLAAHDGFTLADTLAFEHRHNHANGEGNRDGHGENFSWNNGAEGASDDPAVLTRRSAFARAMLGTLFASTGTVMLTAGDEFGRSQRGNNNAYAQDNAITWIDWTARDMALEDHVAMLSRWRRQRGAANRQFPEDGLWQAMDGKAMDAWRWENPATTGFRWMESQPSRPAAFAVDRAGLYAGPLENP
ncbi:glycogen debranching protein GlgX [Novosphingobium cyanobacteriorum]|uniref:Glycogen debranching protein GlgX n=1 Tax=Novosphingobium cyanobacteriorum TaxID=3024215 RepID=A0ABT6CET2_9SPHN|nr:glycogen debranching protein GlgX [Novosphingobium cyanobacteriorum]MDF8332437.1 glycogen debranching protein GlgX [Novosphingobium cyanobacteriorum]